eukprot:gb/GEZN01001378.1/.p1 GENE.gb/GEZN01001378.1/~~gb/GEZN01001378.1/.p1  ORF type:complete len:666 (-),score=37.30 gb/GEZN01001378.1/:978-2975(-)
MSQWQFEQTSLVGPCLPNAVTTPFQPFPVVIEVHTWASHMLHSMAASIVLSEVMGYNTTLRGSNVEWTVIDRLEKGQVHVDLELWGAAKLALLQGVGGDHGAQDLGLLGVSGRSGWYISTHTLVDYPELYGDFWRPYQVAGESNNIIGLIRNDTWESVTNASLRDPASGLYYCEDDAARLAAGTTIANCTDGMFVPPWCVSDPRSCAVLHAVSPDYDSGILQSQILSLRLHIVVAFLANATDALQRNRQGQHQLLYYWKPDPTVLTECNISGTVQKCWSRISLPNPDDRCVSANSGTPSFDVPCDFPEQPLQKVSWAGLQTAAPAVEQFFKSYKMLGYQTDELLDLFAASGDVRASACTWLQNHDNLWKSWLPSPTLDLCTHTNLATMSAELSEQYKTLCVSMELQRDTTVVVAAQVALVLAVFLVVVTFILMVWRRAKYPLRMLPFGICLMALAGLGLHLAIPGFALSTVSDCETLYSLILVAPPVFWSAVVVMHLYRLLYSELAAAQRSYVNKQLSLESKLEFDALLRRTSKMHLTGYYLVLLLPAIVAMAIVLLVVQDTLPTKLGECPFPPPVWGVLVGYLGVYTCLLVIMILRLQKKKNFYCGIVGSSIRVGDLLGRVCIDCKGHSKIHRCNAPLLLCAYVFSRSDIVLVFPPHFAVLEPK